MKKLDEHRFTSDDGMIFVNKTNKVRMGKSIYIGRNDSIDNYIEDVITEEDKSKIKENNKPSIPSRRKNK